MTERRIRLSGAEAAKEFVRVAGKCDFDVDISYNRFIIDAKSLLGVLSMDLSNTLVVKYGGSNIDFERILNKYAA